jgi:hypothetical protein
LLKVRNTKLKPLYKNLFNQQTEKPLLGLFGTEENKCTETESCFGQFKIEEGMKKTLLAMLSLVSGGSFAQSDSTKNSLKISGYIEIYYAYDFSNPSDHNRPGFVYSHNRHNEVNLNLGSCKISVQHR